MPRREAAGFDIPEVDGKRLVEFLPRALRILHAEIVAAEIGVVVADQRVIGTPGGLIAGQRLFENVLCIRIGLLHKNTAQVGVGVDEIGMKRALEQRFVDPDDFAEAGLGSNQIALRPLGTGRLARCVTYLG